MLRCLNFEAAVDPCGTFVEPFRIDLAGACGILVEPLSNCCGALCNLTSGLPKTTPWPSRNRVEPSKRPDRTLVETWTEPSWNLTPNPPRTTPQPSQNLVFHPRATLPQGRPGPPRSQSGLRPQSFQLLGKNHLSHSVSPICQKCLNCGLMIRGVPVRVRP